MKGPPTVPEETPAKLEARTRVVFNLPVNSGGELKAFYDIVGYVQRLKLKRFIATAYRRNGSPQEEVWIVAHRITRQT